MLHKRPTPGDNYCANCGLEEEFWEKVPECPATVDNTNEGEQEEEETLK